ncbi:hypothetical protein [Microbulbifer hydrolyticus]|uniref:Secreted protein n=1 Tax=Microbulbifer hydrolyticus TaxID=48074 RepID=A0AA89TLC4_9GAMM|nr:hypothetical protein [Microbulbifer hydrolyticus]MBB5210986.1 hypothetical protein [Microbulbifer hydrolyticus]
MHSQACKTLLVFLSAIFTAACEPRPESRHAADDFLTNIAAYCGKAFAGKITINEPRSNTPDSFEGKTLVMHVRGCENPASEIRIPFHVGEDHSRTWILTRTGNGLRLKHDHRHEDGSEDAVTMYGGDTRNAGTQFRQEFPVDEESIATFKREGLDASLNNTWAMEIHPGENFIYELTRPNGREFRVQFDLTQPVATPPAPWGY